MAYRQGDFERAATLHEEALALRREVGDTWGIAQSLTNLGKVRYHQGDHLSAEALYQEGLVLSRDIGAKDLMAAGLEGLAWIAVMLGKQQRAAQLSGAAEALREVTERPLPPDLRAGHDQAVRAMHAALGADRFAVAWAEGRALRLEDAVSLAGQAGAEERSPRAPTPERHPSHVAD